MIYSACTESVWSEWTDTEWISLCVSLHLFSCSLLVHSIVSLNESHPPPTRRLVITNSLTSLCVSSCCRAFRGTRMRRRNMWVWTSALCSEQLMKAQLRQKDFKAHQSRWIWTASLHECVCVCEPLTLESTFIEPLEHRSQTEEYIKAKHCWREWSNECGSNV